ESAEVVEALQQDLRGHQAVLAERSQELDAVRDVLGGLEGQHEEALKAVHERAEEEQRHLSAELEAHPDVMAELRDELERNVSAREHVEGDLRRVEEQATQIEAQLRGTQGTLEESVRAREGVEKELRKFGEELRELAEELGGERETLAFMREELSSRWKNLLRAVSWGRREY
ncbi:MAG: hypothetical protein MK291_12920, partial [Planctomycetes bacterium]|nr:hypothetical protein [Planctomycetota bacterium]